MTAQAAKPTKQHKPKNKVTPAKSTAILAMQAAGMNTVEISKEIGLSQPTVWRHLSKITPENLEYQQLIANLPDQFAKLALDNANLSARLTKHLAKMSDEDLGSMNPVNIAAIKRTADVGLGITHDHYRLEAGLSTSNTASIRADIAAIKGLTRDASQQSAPSTQSK
jgi:predicted transcriptional regulator